MVICDSDEDYVNMRQDLMNEFRAVGMFKREGDWRGRDKVFPFPFAAPVESYPDDLGSIEKSIDVFFAMGATHPRRYEIYRALSELRDECNVYAAISSDPDPSNQDVCLRWDLYMKKIASAKIAIAVRGHAWDTDRYWVIPTVGTFMLCNRVDLQIPNPFQEDVHIGCYGDGTDDFKAKVRQYLADDEGRETIAAAGKKHAMKYHTCAARAKWFLEEVEKLI